MDSITHYTFCPAHRLNGWSCLVWPCGSVWAEVLSTTGHPCPWWVGVPSSGRSDRCVWSLYSLHHEESSAQRGYWLLTQTQTLIHCDARMQGLYLLTALTRRCITHCLLWGKYIIISTDYSWLQLSNIFLNYCLKQRRENLEVKHIWQIRWQLLFS